METYIHWLLIGNFPDLENIVDLRLHNFLFKQLYCTSVFVTVHHGNFGNNPRENVWVFFEKPVFASIFDTLVGLQPL